MRRGTAMLAAAIVATSSPTSAEPPRVAAYTSVYTSSDRVVVVSPQVTLRAPIHHDVDVVGGYEADVISAASVDVLSSASPHGYTEVRHGLTAGAVARPLPATTVAARWMPSWEPDFRSHTFSTTLAREWLDRRLTTELGARVAFDRVGRRDTPSSTWRPLESYALDASLAWVLSPRSVGQLSYDLEVLDGYQASPYRLARVGWPGLEPAFGVPEAVPELRVRHGLAVGLRHALGGGFFATIRWRLYRDSWAVTAQTAQLQLQRALLDDALILGVDLRGYEQSAASFYEPRYATQAGELPQYRTADKMLTRSISFLGGARATVVLGRLWGIDRLSLVLKVDYYAQRFFDFLPLTGRRALIPALGLIAEL